MRSQRCPTSSASAIFELPCTLSAGPPCLLAYRRSSVAMDVDALLIESNASVLPVVESVARDLGLGSR